MLNFNLCILMCIRYSDQKTISQLGMRCRPATNKLSMDVYTLLHSKMEIYKKNVHAVRLQLTSFVIEMSLRYERNLSSEKIKRIIKCPFTYILVTRESL